MPSTDRRCTFCSDLIKGNNMARHLQRFHRDQYENDAAESLCHDVSLSRDSSLSAEKETTLHVRTNSAHVSRWEQYENSLGQTPRVSSDDVRSAAHCMLRFTDGLNIPSLSNYLKTFYPSIPEVCRVPVIVATFAAAQKVAAHHMDVVLGNNKVRIARSNQALARWTHGLSAVEPDYNPQPVQRQPVESVSGRDLYSPTSNFLLNREMPVPLTSSFAHQQFEAERYTVPETVPNVIADPSTVESSERRSDMSKTNAGLISVEVRSSDTPQLLQHSAAATESQSISNQAALSVPDRPSQLEEVTTISTQPLPNTLMSIRDELEPGEIPAGNFSSTPADQRIPPSTFTDLLKATEDDLLFWSDVTRPLAQPISRIVTPVPNYVAEPSSQASTLVVSHPLIQPVSQIATPVLNNVAEPSSLAPTLEVSLASESLLEEDPLPDPEVRLTSLQPSAVESSSDAMRRKAKNSTETERPEINTAAEVAIPNCRGSKENSKRRHEDKVEEERGSKKSRTEFRPQAADRSLNKNEKARIPLNDNNVDRFGDRDCRKVLSPHRRNSRQDNGVDHLGRVSIVCPPDRRHNVKPSYHRDERRPSLSEQQRRWLARMPRHYY